MCKELKPKYQKRVAQWVTACFGVTAATDPIERNYRFLEEALELVQACDLSAEEAHHLVDYVYSRPKGERYQEVGGVSVTLAALCHAQGLDQNECAELELARVIPRIDEIRVRQSKKTIVSSTAIIGGDHE